MSRKGPVRNVAASVHAKLLEKAKAINRPFNELFHYYAMERLLYRLSKSKHSKKFVLKGALMFTAGRFPYRALRKISICSDGLTIILKISLPSCRTSVGNP